MMSEKKETGLAVFVKTPGLSPLKTRLAKGIGEEKALEFYSKSISSVESVLKDFNMHWAVAEEEGRSHSLWSKQSPLWTNEGNLGQRQAFVFNSLLQKYKKVILLGADTPQISSEIIEKAISALDSHETVIGPCFDGGYYLFGSKKELNVKEWSEIPWSSSDTLDSLIKSLEEEPCLLENLTDVDFKEDLKTTVSEMKKKPTKEQQSLIDWVQRLDGFEGFLNS